MLGGELSFHFLNVMLLTALVAPLVLWRYRRAVLAGMQTKVGAPIALAPPRGARSREAQAPIVGVDAKLAWEARVRRRIVVAVGAALLPSALLLAAHDVALNDLPVTPAHLWLVAGTATLMAVPMVGVLAALAFVRTVLLGVATLAAFAAMLVVVSMLQRPFYGKAPSADQLLNVFNFVGYAALELALPLALAAAIGARRVRGVAPFVFAGLLVFAFAPLLGVRLTQALAGADWSARWVLAGGIHVGALVLTLPVGLVAWWRLKALARGYDAKRFSDAQLLAHSWWLMFVAVHAIEQVASHPGTALLQIVAVAAVAYLLFPFLLAHALGWAQRGVAAPPRRMLLVLRIFGDSARTGALFARIASRWQRFGPVTTIAAPDAAAQTLDPGDLLRFATGRIGADFIASRDDLARRLATLDVAPDRDGRYRVTELCCRDDTWQGTVVALIARADAIVMDLRGFSAARRGAEFELKQLAARASADRVVLIVDRSSDRALLAQTLAQSTAPFATIEVPRGSARQADAAFAALLAAAA